MKIDLGFNDTPELQKERTELINELKQSALLLSYLKKSGIPSGEIERFPMKFLRLKEQLETCRKCRGIYECCNKKAGYLVTLIPENTRIKEVYTACKYQKEALKKEQKERKKTPYLANYLINDMPKDCFECDLKKIDMEQEKVKYIKAVTAIQERMPLKKGIYLFGDVGVGKTYLAACIANDFAKKDQKVAFVHVPTYLNNLKNSFDNVREYEFYLNSAKRADLLVLDDIGAENVTAWSRDDILQPILNERMNNGLLTVFTSNYSMDSLQEYYTTSNKVVDNELAARRVLERIRVLSDEIEIVARNRRHD